VQVRPVTSTKDIEEKILALLNITGKGLILNNLPSITRGIIVEIMKRQHLTLDDVIGMVAKDDLLWNRIGQENYARIQNVAVRFGSDISWFTTDFFIDTIKKDFPSIASLFLSDHRSYVWLTTQVEVVKARVEQLRQGGNNDPQRGNSGAIPQHEPPGNSGAIPANNPGHGRPGVQPTSQGQPDAGPGKPVRTLPI